MTSTATETPDTRRRRRIGGWVVIAAVLVTVGLIGAVVSSGLQWAQRDVLDPDSAGPRGTRALHEILTEHGVDVLVSRNRAQAIDALADGDATLVLPDSAYLSDDAFTALADAASDVVVIDPGARAARILFPGALTAGYGGGEAVDPSCDSPAAHRAGAVIPGAVFSAPDGATACYPASGGFALLSADRDSGSTAVIDATELFTNEHLAADGNAALAVNLLGGRDRLIWYVASIGDSDLADSEKTLGALTPGWVTPAIVVLLCAGLAAALWRGRRFGPLVAENLPVTVRASETTEGRARLYARSHDALHAADQLRIGALGRVGRLLGLGPAAEATEIADAAAERLGADRMIVRGILIDDIPRTDGDLLALGDRIRDLETAVRGAGPAGSGRERNTP